jgi:hypothetical protein
MDKVLLQLPADEAPPYPVQAMALLVFRPGPSGARGPHRIVVFTRSPTGERKLTGEDDIFFADAAAGQPSSSVMIANVNLRVTVDGLYHFDVEVNGKQIIQMPLQILFQRESPQVQPEPERPAEILEPRQVS